MKKNNLIRITILFFVLMLCFTILSRAAWQAGTAVVQVSKPESRMITHQISALGKVEQNQEYAVVTEADQRVTGIYVQEGQRVKQGDLLFEIDTNLLEEKILHQQQEMEKFRLQMEDAASQKEVTRQQKQNEQYRAAEDYSLNTSRAGTQLSRAKRDLEEAKKRLEEFYQANHNISIDNTVKERLEKDCEEKNAAYIQAEQELTTLQWRIEQAVEKALREAEVVISPEAPTPEAPTPEAPTPEVPISASPTLEAPTPEAPTPEAPTPEAPTPASPTLTSQIPAFQAPTSITLGDNTNDLRLENHNDSLEAEEEPISDDFMPEETAVWVENWSEGKALNADPKSAAEEPYAETGSFSEEPYTIFGSVMEVPTGEPVSNSCILTQEETDRIEKETRDKYRSELDLARKKVETAKAESVSAQAALAQYQQEQSAAMDIQTAETIQQLQTNVRTAQDAYTDAAIAANEVSVTSGRAVRTAGIAEASDSSGRIHEITYEQMQLELEKLEELKQNHGKICSPVDGLVTKLQITTGEKTSDTTAVLLADLSKGYHFTADITKEQEKYLGTGDLVTVTSGTKKKALEDLPVTSVMADEYDENIYHIKIELPEDSLEIGMFAALEFTRKSQTYSLCVPLSALHLDKNNRTYVLIPEEAQSIMGTEIRARKVEVTVVEQNESYAALSEGTLSSRQEILIRSDKPVDEGSRVRIGK